MSFGVENSVVSVVGKSDSTAMSRSLLQYSHVPPTSEGTPAIPEGCDVITPNLTGFKPWDNPDNIVSAQVELTANKIFERIVVPSLFLIGGPANVLNMAVFYKQSLKDRINLCLFALSLADALYLTQAIFIFGEQLTLEFNTDIKFGPMQTFMVNHNFIVLFGLTFISQILSAIIATERCVCVVSPLKFHTLLRTRTMAVIIVVIYVVVLGLNFLMVFKYTIGCVYDPVSGTAHNGNILGEFYLAHMDMLDYLDSFVFRVGVHGFSITVVTTATIITIVKLRQLMTWRAGSSTSISVREVALTKMLIGSSLLFIVCVIPHGLFHFTVLFFKDLNAGRRYHNLYFTLVWIADITTFINSTFNFFIYYAMGSRFRQTFWALFGKTTKSDKE